MENFANFNIPDTIRRTISDFEFHPCREFPDPQRPGHTLVEQMDTIAGSPDGIPSFWSVYVHYHEGGLDCVTDHKTKEEAEKLCDFLNFLLQGAKTKEQRIIEKASMFLCDGEKTVAEQVQIIRDHPEKYDMLDWIEGVDVVSRFETSFTAEQFIEEIES